MNRVQIVWRWKKSHLPKGESRRWHFVAHGAPYDRDHADEFSKLIQSHGKDTKFLPLAKGD